MTITASPQAAFTPVIEPHTQQGIPREHIENPVTSLVMGLPLDLQFRTKGQLAMDICADCYADGLKFDFACGDESMAGARGCGSFSRPADRPTCCGSRPAS
jgi:hypothetical protein